METYRLRYFSAVARTGSMRQAAELLRISPAALSKAISLLEHDLRTKLLLPSGRGVILSEAGQRLAGKIEPLLEQLERLGEELRTGRIESKASLRIASFEVFTTWLLGPILEKHFPEVPVLVHELLPGKMESAVAEGIVDLAISYLPIPLASLDHLKIATLEMAVYAKRGAFEKTPFESLPFAIPISPVTGSPNKVRGLDGWPDDKIPRNVRYRVTLMETALELCRRSMAVAYLPSPVVKFHNECVKERFALERLAMPKIAERATRQDVYLIKRKSDAEDPVFKRLAAAIRILCR